MSLEVRDERVRAVPLLGRLLSRPELGAIAGTVLIFVFFAITAGDSGLFSAKGIVNFLEVSAQLGILAAAVALLMIAGEFDLSVGSMIGFAGIIIAIPPIMWDWPVWASVLLAFASCAFVGYLNGLIVVHTGLPSFIVTLGSLFMLRGLTLGVTRGITGRTQASGLHEYSAGDWITPLFAGQVLKTPIRWLADIGLIGKRADGLPAISGIPVSIVWWIGLTVFFTWLLSRTRFGNWIFASGGEANAARNMGVPVARTKITLFILTALAAALFAAIQVLVTGSADTLRGNQKEFEAIIAVVIGGTLLTGGYGSAIGAMFGALIFGVVQMGIFYTGIDTDWFKLFMGAMMVIAVLFNSYVRSRAMREQVMITPLVELKSVSKYFGSVIALKDVSFDVRPGEVHCLLGDNGAGKSTLIKVLSGVHLADEGEILVGGAVTHFSSPKDTLDKGIATVYQDLALVPLMSVARNFFGREPQKRMGPLSQFDVEYANRTAYQQLSDMGIQLRDPEQPVGTLSGGERQCLAIARAIHFGAKVLILDEPTSALGVHQASVVLKLIVQSKARGIGVIFISHNVHHAYGGDRFTLLKRGRSAGTYLKNEISRDQLLNLMAGGKELVDLEQEIVKLNGGKR